ncbi:MAG: phage holin family protein [Beutenbergiaceae bacterium]
MLRFIVQVAINGLALWVASKLVDGVDIVAGAGIPQTEIPALNTALLVGVIALIFTVVNQVIKPIVKVLALPVYLLTLGLFFLVVNALMLMLTSWISGFTDFGLTVDSFWDAVVAGLLISITSAVLSVVLPEKKRDRR